MIYRLFCLSGLLSLVGAGLLQASDCRRVVAAPVVAYTGQSYAIPSYTYGETILYPRAVVVRSRAEYAAGIGEEIRQEEFAKRIALEYFRLVEESKKQGLPSAGGPGGTIVPPQNPIDVSPRQELKSGTLTAQNVLDKHCIQCHAKGQRMPDLSDANRVDELNRLRSVRATAEGSMPKNKPQIAQDEYNVLVAWSKQLAPKQKN